MSRTYQDITDLTKIISKDFLYEVAKGNVPGHGYVQKFGSGTLTTSLLPVTQTNNYATPTTPQSLEFVSSNAADALNGVGAREITFIGLDANWEEQTVSVATHATDGTVPVAIPGTWFRLYRKYVSQSGTYATQLVGSHSGIITTRIAGAGSSWIVLPITPFQMGQSQIGCYTVPTGKTAFLISKNVSVDASKVTDLYFFQRPNADDVTSPYTGTMRIVEREIGINSPHDRDFKIPKGPFVGPCDIGYMGKVSLTTGVASVEFELIVIDNELLNLTRP